MFRPYEINIAIRYLRARSGNGFISFISLVSMVGIALGVAVLVVVLSVMNGFERELQERILSMTAHATINGFDGPLPDWASIRRTALSNDGVLAAAPFVEGQGLLINGERSSGAGLRAVDPQLEATVSRVPELMQVGELSVLTPGSYNIVLGSALAEQLGVGLGDKVIAVVAQGRVTPAGIVPRMRRFTVAGIFNAGMYEYDRGLGLIAFADGQRLFQTGERATGLRLSVAEPLLAYDFARQLALGLGGPYYVSDWTRQHRNFFRSIKLTKTIMFIILLMVVGVAAFNIISTLAMVVRDKSSDIAILKTMGSRAGSISTIFAVQGTLIGLVGTLVGVLVGILLANQLTAIVTLLENLLGIDLLAADVYFISDLPAFVNPFEVAQITILAMVLVWVATLVPALRAARIEPAKALRHE
jgi:lipoprotein-releasing system permease protein